MGKFAATTTVSVEKSELEVKQTLRRYDVQDIATLTRPGVASILFSKEGRTFRFSLEVPSIEELAYERARRTMPSYRTEPSQYDLQEARKWAQEKGWQQEERRIWRVLIMVLKAHFELAEEIGVDEAFASHIVLPGGQTVAEYMLPRLDYAKATGVLPDPFDELMPPKRLPGPGNEGPRE